MLPVEKTLISLPEIADSSQKLGDYLLEKGLLTPAQLHAALAEQQVTNEKLGTILNRDSFISQRELLDAILATNPDKIQGDAFYSTKVPEEVLLKTRTMLVAETPERVFLVTLDSEAQSKAELQQYYPSSELVFVSGNFDQVDRYLDTLASSLKNEASILDKLLRKAFSTGVSDIHIEPRHNSYTVFFRHLGVRRHEHEGSMSEYNKVAARIKDLSRMDLAERRIPQDGAFQFEFNGRAVDLRVSTLPVNQAENIVVRLLDADRVQPNLSKLGITRISEWRKGTSRPHGLCLIVGPTGGGKTTTLNATLREFDRFSKNILTLEDPVELKLQYLTQVNVNPALGLDFAAGVKAFMRNDPDIIVVGEIRDAETARNAIKAADTGHLVIATMHASSCYSTAHRLKDLGVEPYELVDLLRVILVQDLIRCKCSFCKGAGCSHCLDTGFGGRTIISECAYFPTGTEVQSLLDGKMNIPSVTHDAVIKAQQGFTTEEEVLRVRGEEAREIFSKERAV